MNRLFVVLTFLAASPLLLAADDLIDADRPGIADGSHTVRRHAFQIELGVESDHAAEGRTLTTPLLLRYGVTERFEARVETSAFTRVSGQSGDWAPVSIGCKYHFRDQPSAGVIARLTIPSGTGDQRTNRVSGDVRLVADFSFGEHWSINPNAGLSVDRFAAETAALTVLYNFTDRVNAFVDGGLQTPEERHGAASLLLDTGAAWIIGRDLQLDASVGWGAHGRSVPDVFWSAGVSRRF